MRAFALFTPLLVLGLLVAPALGDEPDLKEIISKADRTTKAVKEASYKVKVWAEGELKIPQPRIEATVKAKEGLHGQLPLVWIDGLVTLPGSDVKHSFHLILNDKQVAAIDKKEKVCTIGDLPEAIDMISEPLKAVVVREFLHPTPFSDELNADSWDYEGKKIVAGTECHVIYVVYAGGAETRWYFGVDDFLPHRVDRIFKSSKGKLARVLELSELDVSPKFDQTTFAIHVPEGFQQKKYTRSEPGLLSVGSKAPDWTLKTPAGKAVTLSKLRGRIVVLDFWAIWCGPCKLVMPNLQKLHEQYKDKPVDVIGLNVWERSDAAAYMKKNKYTYGLLLKGDAVAKAYGVNGIPTMYIIGPDGKILHASAGFNPANEKAITGLIDAALAKMKSNP